MIGYNCKYTPVEILACFDDYRLINNETEHFDYSSQTMHANVCSHIKAICEEIHRGYYDKLVFMNCCDSTRRLFDVAESKIKYKTILDLPIDNGACAVKRLKNDLLFLIKDLESVTGKAFDTKEFLSNFSDKPIAFPTSKFILVLGANANGSLMNVIREAFQMPVINMTCSNNRCVSNENMSESDSLDELMEKYARALMAQTPCMRMSDTTSRKQLLNNENLAGIVYHTIKFCDYYCFEYTKLADSKTPILKIETDYTTQQLGQLSTRLEAFCETLNTENNSKIKMNENGKYYAGIDSGSTSTELVIFDENKNIVKAVMVRTGANAQAGAQKALDEAKISLDKIKTITATGYGRKNIDFANDDVTEITCHARGARFLYPEARYIIDIGGQDSKFITLDENGNVASFVMNDKCAAGTGRFLENMAKALEISMEQMANDGLKFGEDISISNMCTVFAESEVISLISENKKIADIIHGLNKSVAIKTKALASKAVGADGVMMTGGVANNKGVVTELEKQLNTKIFISDKPEFCGAIGAGLFAVDSDR